MNEQILINKILEILDKNGANDAYQFLLKEYDSLEIKSAIIYNFLFGLAALNGNKNETIDWIRISIEEKGFWYKPEVFESSELDFIRNEVKFKELVKISNLRYKSAFKKGEIKCTLTDKIDNNIALVLHGNKQDNEISKSFWYKVYLKNTQIEYLQSSHIDSDNLAWWHNDFDYVNDIIKELHRVKYFDFDKKILCGFSSGCNTILKLISKDITICNKVIFVAPYIPDDNYYNLVKTIIKANIEVFIICGLNDALIDRVKKFEKLIIERKGLVKALYIENQYHTYPNDFEKVIKDLVTID